MHRRMPDSEDFQHPTRILVRTPNWLGDLLMGTAFVQAVLHQFPSTPVDLVVRKGFEALPLPHRGEVLPFDKKQTSADRFGRELSAKGYSHLFVLPPSFSAAWMAYRSGIPYRIGYRGQGRNWLLRPAVTHTHTHRSVHLVEEYLGLLSPWSTVTASEFPPQLVADETWVSTHFPKTFDLKPPYVVLAPGAEYGPAKQWPVEHFQQTAQALSKAGLNIVVTGLPQDQSAGEMILNGIKNGANLCGVTTLQELTALLARAALVISNDSGAMHLTAALHRPQIALFGSSNPTWTSPANTKAHTFHLGLDCAPCYKRTCPLGHTRCLTEIHPDKVIEKALTMAAVE